MLGAVSVFEPSDRGKGRSEHWNKAGVHERIRGLLTEAGCKAYGRRKGVTGGVPETDVLTPGPSRSYGRGSHQGP